MSQKKPAARNNLVALGSAAVLTIYSAGYVRTRAAAELFANETDDHRVGRPAPKLAMRGADNSSAPKPESLTATAPKPLETHDVPTFHALRPKSRSRDTIAATPAADSSRPPSPTTPPVAPMAVAQNPAPVDSTRPPRDSTPRDSVRRTGWRDGTYRGYGTSRHGDIEAEIKIENGRITSARVSQCLTQYSCSWISPLPPEVVQRQSAEVDYVSGATQSTYAFYYAVLDALSKAK